MLAKRQRYRWQNHLKSNNLLILMPFYIKIVFNLMSNVYYTIYFKKIDDNL